MITIKPATSYSINTKSDFIYNIIKEYIYEINKENGIARGITLFGKYIEESDNPIKGNYIITRKEVEGIEVLELLKRPQIIEAIAITLKDSNRDFINFCKVKLKDKSLDTIYYYMNAIHYEAVKNDKLDETRAKYIISEYVYKGVHSNLDKYYALIRCIQNPEPKYIYNMFKVFNDENGGYKSLTTAISNLVYRDKLPSFIYGEFKQIIENTVFDKQLLHFAVSMLTASNREELAIKLLTRG